MSNLKTYGEGKYSEGRIQTTQTCDAQPGAEYDFQMMWYSDSDSDARVVYPSACGRPNLIAHGTQSGA
jgi:hypothetical protein